MNKPFEITHVSDGLMVVEHRCGDRLRISVDQNDAAPRSKTMADLHVRIADALGPRYLHTLHSEGGQRLVRLIEEEHAARRDVEDRLESLRQDAIESRARP